MTRLGMLTPSSNTALEPITYAMLAGVEGVSVHFSRFKVTEITLSVAGGLSSITLTPAGITIQGILVQIN